MVDDKQRFFPFKNCFRYYLINQRCSFEDSQPNTQYRPTPINSEIHTLGKSLMYTTAGKWGMVFFIRSLLYSTASWGEVWCSITDLSSTAVAMLRFALGLGSRNRAMRECPEPWIFFSEKSFLMSSNLNRWGTINLTLFNSLCAAATSANNTEVVLTHLPQK